MRNDGCVNHKLKSSWKAECWRIDAFELWFWRRLLRVSWTARRSNQSILKEIGPGISLGRNDAEAETPVLWPPHVKSWLIGKDSDAGRDWGKEEKGTTEDEMVGWHHWLDGREFEWTPGDGGGQGVLACCDPWGRKESYTTEWLNWTEFLTSRNITGQAHTPEFPCIPGQQSLHSSQQVQYKKTHSYSLIKQKHNSEYYDRGS